MSLAISKTILFDTTQWIGIIVFVSYSRRARYNSFSLIVLLILGGGETSKFLRRDWGSICIADLYFLLANKKMESESDGTYGFLLCCMDREDRYVLES